MNFKEKMKDIIIKDYINVDCKRVFKLREYLKKENGNIFLKAIKLREYKKICYRNNAFIPIKANLGDNIVFPHGIMGICISSGATIGDNCTIFHQVTIGSNTLKDTKKNGSPTIGNNVYIGAGAKIIGNIKIGNNVRIGANCAITEDIPDNATVVLEKNRIIMHNEKRNNVFYKYNDNNK